MLPDRPLTTAGPAHSREQPDATDWVDSEILVADAPRLLDHRWGFHRLLWTLEPTPEGCRLTLEQVINDPADPLGPRVAILPGTPVSHSACWHVCLAVLAVGLDSDPDAAGAPERVVGRAMAYGYAELAQRYRHALG